MKQGRSLKEVKAEQAAKKRKARRRKRAIVLFVELFVLVMLLGTGYIMSKYGKFQLNILGDGDIAMNEGAKKEGYTTVALFGGDSREGQLEAGTHADTIMVVSIDNDTKEVKLVSIYRDLLTKQPDGEIKKANNAYFVGGPKDAINMLNENFDLSIEDYVTVDFNALVDVVDLLGGIEADVSEAEAAEMNNHIYETARIAGQDIQPMRAGQQTLNGVEAVTYARIRKNNTGGDYARTERQQHVIQQLVFKAKQMDLMTLNGIIDKVFPQVSTSFSLKELIGLAAGVMQYKLGETTSFAFEYTDGRAEGIGSVVIPLGVIENVQELHAFLYPTEEYIPSDTVKKIAREIEKLTGYTRADYQESDATTGTEDSDKTESEE